MEMVMNITNTPYEWWPLCVEYVVMVKNHTARASLKERTPIEKRTGQTPDVSKLLQFHWWEPMYFLDEYGTECLGRWAGVAEHVGDELTFVVVSDTTGFAMYRSDLRMATDPDAPNFRAETLAADKKMKSAAQDTGNGEPYLQLANYRKSARSKRCILMHPMNSSARRLCSKTVVPAILSDMKLFAC
jgi:hypothetical protein